MHVEELTPPYCISRSEFRYLRCIELEASSSAQPDSTALFSTAASFEKGARVAAEEACE